MVVSGYIEKLMKQLLILIFIVLLYLKHIDCASIIKYIVILLIIE